MYITDTGETRLYITIDPETPSNRLDFDIRFQSTIANNTTIDWGDGTTPEIKGSTTAQFYQHIYAEPGEYVIKLKVNSGKISFIGGAYAIYGNTSGYNHSKIKKIEIGNDVTTLGNSIFSNCYSLISVTIPNSVTAFGNSTFSYCYSLKSVTIPNGITNIDSQMFSNCCSLTSIILPSSITSIGTNAFQNCYAFIHISIPNGIINIDRQTFYNCTSLMNLFFPSSLLTIGTYTFSNCHGLGELHFYSTTPPTIDSSTLGGIPSDCKIYVPTASVDTYKSASNWSTYASYIYGE